MIKIIWISLLSIAVESQPTNTIEPEVCLTIEEAMSLALASDPRMMSAEARRDIARADLMASYSRNLPQISAFGQTGFGDTPPLDRQRDEQVGFQLQQELYSFGSRRFAQEASKAQLDSAKYGIILTEFDIAQSAALAFLDYQRSTELLALAEQQVEVFKSDAEAALSRLERRVITLTDASQIRSRYAVARSEQTSALLNQDIAKTRLFSLIQKEINCLSEGSIDFLFPKENLASPSLLSKLDIEETVFQSHNLKQARAEVAAAQATVSETSRANLPVLSATGFATYEYDPFTDEFIDQSRIGLSLSQDLYTGGRNKARRLDAKARLKSARAEAAIEQQRLRDTLSQALTEVKGYQKANQDLSQALKQAEIRQRTTLLEYDLGTKTLTDLVLANEDYFRAATQETNIRYDMYASLVRLYAIAETLVPQQTP